MMLIKFQFAINSLFKVLIASYFLKKSVQYLRKILKVEIQKKSRNSKKINKIKSLNRLFT